MKKLLALSFVLWSFFAQAQQITVWNNKLDQNSIVKSTSGTVYSYNDWKNLIMTGNYNVKKTFNAQENNREEYVVYLMTDAQKQNPEKVVVDGDISPILSAEQNIKPIKINKYLNAQYNQNYLAKTVILKDKDGKTYTYEVWKPLLESGDYAVKKKNLGESDFIIYKLTDNERTAYHKNVETPGYYKSTYLTEEESAARKIGFPKLDKNTLVKTVSGNTVIYSEAKELLQTGNYILKKGNQEINAPNFVIVEMDVAQKEDFVKRMTKLKLAGMGIRYTNKLPSNIDIIKGEDGKIYNLVEGSKLFESGDFNLVKINNPKLGEPEYIFRRKIEKEKESFQRFENVRDTAFFAERLYITDKYLARSDAKFSTKFVDPTPESIVRGEDGNVYPYANWKKLVATGNYVIKSRNTFENGQPEYLLHKRTAEQLATALAGMKKPRVSESFVESEKFNGLKITDMKGNKYDLRNPIGKVIVLNFWFINCPPCKAEIPQLNEITESYTNKDVIFLAIALDEKSNLKDFLLANPFYYNVVDGGRSIASNYGVKLYPTHVVIDKTGAIKFSTVGLASNTLYWLKKSIDESLN